MSKDKGWDYLNSDDVNDTFNSEDDNDSWGYKNEDGSGSYYGADGSWGYKNSDGSGSYYGADGSWGYKNSDGSVSYYGEDGSWGYKNSDGSGSYYGADNNATYYDSEDEDGEDESTDSSDLVSDLVGLAFTLGGAAIANSYAKSKEKARKEETRLEQLRIEEEKRRIHQEEKDKKRRIRNKRLKALFFNKKNIQLEFSTSDYVGTNIKIVENVFMEAGFNNVKSIPIKDIYVDSHKNVGEVEQIVINGQSLLSNGTMVPFDAEIILTFHVKKEFVFPYSGRQMVKRNFEDLANELLKIGFTEIFTLPLKDLSTGWMKKEYAVQNVVIEGVDAIKKGMILDYDKKITIQYHSFK